MAEELNLECFDRNTDTLNVTVSSQDWIEMKMWKVLSEEYVGSVVLNKQSSLDLACFLLKEDENLAD